MKQLLVLSGKGGTGKTTIASAFIKLSKCRAYADCDVDAPNLHLVVNQSVQPRKSDYYGLPKLTKNCVCSVISAGKIADLMRLILMRSTALIFMPVKDVVSVKPFAQRMLSS